jgi:fermentation-respiration switch protein FrsA (DUF1100 family)
MRYPGGDWDAAKRYGLSDVWFESVDGTKLHGWLAEHERPRGALLFCHGNAGNVTHRADVVDLLRGRLGMTVFVFDYRGYGRSEGIPDEHGVVTDAEAARAWLAGLAGVAPAEIVLLGRSLGGAVATRLATEGGARALVLESTFTSAADMGAAIYPFFPVRLLMRNRFETLGRIGGWDGPLLVSHGTHDEIIPFDHGRQLFEAAGTQVKEFVPVQGGTHNVLPPPEYYDALAVFLERVL